MDTMPTVDSAMSYSPATSSMMASMDEDDMTLEAKQCLQALKEGKRSKLRILIIKPSYQIVMMPELCCLVAKTQCAQLVGSHATYR